MHDLDAKRLLFATEGRGPRRWCGSPRTCRPTAAIRPAQVRRTEMVQDPRTVRAALDTGERKTLKQLLWGMRRNPDGWSADQTQAMDSLQRFRSKSARA